MHFFADARVCAASSILSPRTEDEKQKSTTTHRTAGRAAEIVFLYFFGKINKREIVNELEMILRPAGAGL